jgi:hypothetical protein
LTADGRAFWRSLVLAGRISERRGDGAIWTRGSRRVRRIANSCAIVTLGAMPLSRIDITSAAAADAWPASPRAAALQALVYRRRLREPPRDRVLRIAALVGALLIHLVFVFGVILGPAYDLPESDVATEALMVRLIDKPEPPPPPPVRGRAPRQATSRITAASTAKAYRSRTGAAALPAPPLTPSRPTVTPPVIAMTRPQTAPIRAPVAQLSPQSPPQSAPTPQLAPIPVPATPPPTLAIQAPATAIPVPPKFQPEPVRVARAEGTEAMPDPASLALPEVTTPALPQAEVPQIVLPPTVAAPVAISAPSVNPAVVAAPPVPDLQAIPLPTQPAPTVTLDGTPRATAPVAPAVQPQVQRDIAAVVEESSPLAPVPLAEPAARPAVTPPQAQALPVPALSTPLASVPLPTTTSMAPDAVAPAAGDSSRAEASDPASATDVAAHALGQADAGSAGTQASSGGAQNALADGAAAPGNADAGLPGDAPGGTGRQASSRSGQGITPQAQGRAGARDGTLGNAAPPGSYVQVQPHGDTRIMSHDLPPIGYTPTRFDKDWTPLHESSVDTVVRRVAEKLTVRRTFNLPHGVRLNCMISPLGWVIALGCAPDGPQQTALASSVYARLSLAPTHSLVPPAPATSTPAPVTLALDNSAACASARVAHAPPPPGCQPVSVPVAAPLSSSGSWVPASDQFH